MVTRFTGQKETKIDSLRFKAGGPIEIDLVEEIRERGGEVLLSTGRRSYVILPGQKIDTGFEWADILCQLFHTPELVASYTEQRLKGEQESART